MSDSDDSWDYIRESELEPAGTANNNDMQVRDSENENDLSVDKADKASAFFGSDKQSNDGDDVKYAKSMDDVNDV